MKLSPCQVPGFASYFLTYEYLSRACSRSDGTVSPLVVLTAGGMAGAASWVFSYPIDVIKTRLQVGSLVTHIPSAVKTLEYTVHLPCAAALLMDL